MSALASSALFTAAAPACSECGKPVARLEQSWTQNGDGDFVPRQWVLVCPAGHRKAVEL